jgi:sterol desaturase/sphingolipid hydroxylase (fatty acid hydroxylase superfamily)
MDFPNVMLEHGEDLQYVLFFGALALFAVAERAFPRRPGNLGRRARWPTNWTLTVLSILSLPLVPVSFLGAALWAESRGIGLLNQVALPGWALVSVTLLIRGLLSTGTHWLNHKLPWLWRIHRVHHLDTDLDVSSTVRFHPLEFFVGAVIGAPLVVAFGLPAWVLAFYELLDVSVTVFSHSNTRLPGWLDRWLRYLIVTPDLHRVHHSTRQPETDSNYGAVFPIWDLVFGTFRTIPRERHAEMTLGLDDLRGADAQRILPLLVSPLRARLAPPIRLPRASPDAV